MSRSEIRNLAPEEIALIPVYIEKWKSIALSTERIDRQAAIEAVQVLYAQWDIQPEIRFFDSPHALLSAIQTDLPNWDRYGEIDLLSDDEFLRSDSLSLPIPEELRDSLFDFLQSFWMPVLDAMFKLPDIPREIASNYCHDQIPQHHLIDACEFDFCNTVLNYSLSATEQSTRQMFQSLVSNSGWMFSLYEAWDENDEEIEDGPDRCWICDRPTKLLLDSENRLHAEDEPAIEYADGFNVWAHHGVLIAR
jgi:hypothetical protein